MNKTASAKQKSAKPWVILLYYQYVPILDAAKFAYDHLKLCKKLGLKGRILVADNGINGTIGGPKKATDAYVKTMHADPRFKTMEFKTGTGTDLTFKKIFVRYRPELVTMKYPEQLDPNTDGGKYVEPEELKAMFDRNEDFVIIDMRNDYEAEIGRFKNAVTLPMQNFKQLPEIVEKHLMQYKNSKVVTYCTGGIRCETATVLLKKKGFRDVSQLRGGVHVFGQKFPDHYWEGKLYVFDERIAVPINTQKNRKILSKCLHCGTPCDDYINCINPECNKQIIVCPDCRISWNDGCSKTCSLKPRTARIQPQTT
jgi:UPF0176 protein